MPAKRSDSDDAARPRREVDELLAAYVDGVGELTIEERRRVERALAANPALRAEQDETRSMLDKLRELPPEPTIEPPVEPDWGAMERAIADAVGDDVPRRSWFYRWRFALPAFALAGAALLVLALRDRGATDEPMPITFIPTLVTPTPAPEVTPDRVAVYLDGAELELELESAAEAEAEIDELAILELDPTGSIEPLEASLGFLESTDLAFIDELDDAALARAERLLDRHLRRKGS